MGEPERYLKAAAAGGLRLRYVIDTHVHADHLSAGRELAAAAGAEYILHASAGARFQFRAVEDGDVLSLGNVDARVLHVPGHTPEHLALVVTDRTRGPEPWFVLTGHTLMVGDMGRTELASSAEVGAGPLFLSAERLRALPDHVRLLTNGRGAVRAADAPGDSPSPGACAGDPGSQSRPAPASRSLSR